MKAATWKKRIIKACEEAGTYRECFISVIDTLANLMEERDNAKQLFEESGGQTVIEYTNKAGATNQVKNPALVVLMDCDNLALSYWRDLGLTPAGLKKLKADAMKEETRQSFGDVLAGLGI